MKLRKVFFSLTLAASGISTAACGAADSSIGAAATALTGQPCSETGATAPAKDGCNTCTCSAGSWACTEKACVSGTPGGAGSGAASGGTGSGTPSGGTCDYGGQQYKVGDVFASSDGCNSCGCVAGGAVACTERACLPGAGGSPSSTPGELASLVGVWKGYVENFTLQDGSDVLTINISSDGLAKVAFGTDAPPPPPVDPNVGYPPGLGSSIDVAHGVWPGFAFTMMNASFDGSRLKFGLARNELWNDWCALQTPVADMVNTGFYGCLPNWGFSASDSGCSQPNPDSGENVPVDCGKLFLCSRNVCNCTQDSCSGVLSTDTYLDMVIAGPKADGSAKINGVLYNVHLTKQ